MGYDAQAREKAAKNRERKAAVQAERERIIVDIRTAIELLGRDGLHHQAMTILSRLAEIKSPALETYSNSKPTQVFFDPATEGTA